MSPVQSVSHVTGPDPGVMRPVRHVTCFLDLAKERASKGTDVRCYNDRWPSPRASEEKDSPLNTVRRHAGRKRARNGQRRPGSKPKAAL